MKETWEQCDGPSNRNNISLRDWLAGLAMQSLMLRVPLDEEWTEKAVATEAYKQADAMLKVREEKKS